MKMDEFVNLSKFMSYVLRHNASLFGLSLEKEGWLSVESLIQAGKQHNYNLTNEKIEEIVQKCNKKRFQFSEDKLKIRTVQGHSDKSVNLVFNKAVAPEYLFHGTATQFLESILLNGLKKMNRHFVHLSPNVKTASKVGERHGDLVMLRVKSKEMENDGFQFNLSENNVWLIDSVPSKYIEVLN